VQLFCVSFPRALIYSAVVMAKRKTFVHVFEEWIPGKGKIFFVQCPNRASALTGLMAVAGLVAEAPDMPPDVAQAARDLLTLIETKFGIVIPRTQFSEKAG